METCDYCHAIGACPQCWGRAGYDRLTQEKAALLEALQAITINVELGEYESQKLGLPRHIEVLAKSHAAIRAAKGERA